MLVVAMKQSKHISKKPFQKTQKHTTTIMLSSSSTGKTIAERNPFAPVAH
jgi:hypothetical protein